MTDLSKVTSAELFAEQARRDNEWNKQCLEKRRIAREAWELEHDTVDAKSLGLTLERYREIKDVVIGTHWKWEEAWQ